MMNIFGIFFTHTQWKIRWRTKQIFFDRNFHLIRFEIVLLVSREPQYGLYVGFTVFLFVTWFSFFLWFIFFCCCCRLNSLQSSDGTAHDFFSVIPCYWDILQLFRSHEPKIRRSCNIWWPLTVFSFGLFCCGVMLCLFFVVLVVGVLNSISFLVDMKDTHNILRSSVDQLC